MRNQRRLLAAVGIEVLVLLFIGFFGTDLPSQSAVIRIGAQLFAIPVVLLWIWAVRRGGSPLDGVLAVGVVLYAVVALFSLDQQGSLQTLGLVAIWAMLFVGMYQLARVDWMRQAVALGVSGALVAWLVVFAVRWIGEKVEWVSLGGGMPNLAESSQTLLWLTTNVVPVLVLLGIPFLADLPPGRGRRALTLAFVATAIVVVPLSGGRAAWLGLAVAGVAFASFTGWTNAVEHLRRFQPRTRLLLAGVACLVVIALLVSAERVLTATSLAARFPLWAEALGILAEHPLTGGGPGTYSWLRLTQVPQYGDSGRERLAHNVPLQTVADGGLLLAAISALLLVSFVAVLWRNRQRLDHWEKLAAAVLAGFATACLLDDHSSLNAVIAMAVILGAWLLASAEPGPERPVRWSLAARTVVAFALAASLFALVPIDQGRLASERGVSAAIQGDWEAARVAFRIARDAYPANATYHVDLGMALAAQGDSTAARAEYERAKSLSPGDPRPYGALAALSGTETDSLQLLASAAERGGRDPQFAFRFGVMLADNGRLDAAGTAFATAAVINDALLGKYARSLSADLQRRIQFQLSAVYESVANNWRIGLHNLEQSAILVWNPTSTEADAVTRAVAGLRDGNVAAALNALDIARQADPASARVWGAIETAALIQCDQEDVERARTMQRLLGAGVRGSYQSVIASFDPFYRELDLGPSQPLAPVFTRDDLDWPSSFIGPAPPCGA